MIVWILFPVDLELDPTSELRFCLVLIDGTTSLFYWIFYRKLTLSLVLPQFQTFH